MTIIFASIKACHRGFSTACHRGVSKLVVAALLLPHLALCMDREKFEAIRNAMIVKENMVTDAGNYARVEINGLDLASRSESDQAPATLPDDEKVDEPSNGPPHSNTEENAPPLLAALRTKVQSSVIVDQLKKEIGERDWGKLDLPTSFWGYGKKDGKKRLFVISGGGSCTMSYFKQTKKGIKADDKVSIIENSTVTVMNGTVTSVNGGDTVGVETCIQGTKSVVYPFKSQLVCLDNHKQQGFMDLKTIVVEAGVDTARCKIDGSNMIITFRVESEKLGSGKRKTKARKFVFPTELGTRFMKVVYGILLDAHQ